MKNKHGLNRAIPETIKRRVRKRCGFGCIICGTTITQYEHFLPDFADSQDHIADNITLLCPDHHSLVTKGVISKDQVKQHNDDPAAKRIGFSKFSHPWFSGIPSLIVGGGG